MAEDLWGEFDDWHLALMDVLLDFARKIELMLGKGRDERSW